MKSVLHLVSNQPLPVNLPMQNTSQMMTLTNTSLLLARKSWAPGTRHDEDD